MSVIYQDARGNFWAKKDPHSRLDYPFDWSAWLADAGDTLVTAEFEAVGVTAETAQAPSGGVAYPWVSGGVAGQPASVTCRITTAGGRVDDRTLNFLIVER